MTLTRRSQRGPKELSSSEQTRKEKIAAIDAVRCKLTPLMIACSKGHQEIVNALLYSDDIDINLTDSAGQTALFHSALHGHCEVLQSCTD